MTLLDVGANAEARREHLVQFAFMGAALAPRVLGVERPRVGLLSNGEEAERGSALVLEAHAELRERASAGLDAFEFVGNVEGGDVVGGAADVIVTDGLTGNIALKLMEGVSQTMLGAVREAAMSSPRGQARRPAAARRAARAFASRSTPRPAAAPTCSACAASASCRTGASRAPASRRRSCARSAARVEDIVGQTHARARARQAR